MRQQDGAGATTSGQPGIAWTWPRLAKLRTAIHDAESAGLEEFSFMGRDFYVGYARHLAAYLGIRLREESGR